MNPTVVILCAFGIPAIVVIVFILSLCWVARGESDVNGDPERDAGYTDEEIYEMERQLYPPALSRAERELIHQRDHAILTPQSAIRTPHSP